MEKRADLHTHTHYSDGMLSPEKLLQKAANVGLSAIAITDHDTVDGCMEALTMADQYGVEVLIGCEFSCYENGFDYHILGYSFNPHNPMMEAHFQNFRKTRLHRAKQIHHKLEHLGFKFDFDLILKRADKAPVTRPHIAGVMVELGYVESLKEAFVKYIGDGCPAFYPKATFPVEMAISMINRAGGVAIIAHPRNSVEQSILYRFINAGLDGIEVYHPSHNEQHVRHYHSVANQYWLLETGGSDYHGTRDFEEENFGKFTVPYSVVQSIKIRKH